MYSNAQWAREKEINIILTKDRAWLDSFELPPSCSPPGKVWKREHSSGMTGNGRTENLLLFLRFVFRSLSLNIRNVVVEGKANFNLLTIKKYVCRNIIENVSRCFGIGTWLTAKGFNPEASVDRLEAVPTYKRCPSLWEIWDIFFIAELRQRFIGTKDGGSKKK